MRRSLVLLAALLPIAVSAARAGTGGADPGAESMGNAGGLGVQLVLTADEQGFRQAWNQAAPPKLRVTGTVRRGAPVSAMLIFGGCAPNAAGVCDLESEFLLDGPDGSRVPAGSGPIWQGKPLAPGRFQLGTLAVTMSFDQADPVGDYRIAAKVKDRVSGKVVSVSTGLQVTQ